MMKYFADEKVGCVAGEKRIENSNLEKAVEAGEGLYWQYESLIKRLESESGSAVGAVGELFAIRTELYKEVREDTILDDFVISLQIAADGYGIKYAPACLGYGNCINFGTRGIEAENTDCLRRMANPFSNAPVTEYPLKHGFLSCKYFSHKVLRWTLVPCGFSSGADYAIY